MDTNVLSILKDGPEEIEVGAYEEFVRLGFTYEKSPDRMYQAWLNRRESNYPQLGRLILRCLLDYGRSDSICKIWAYDSSYGGSPAISNCVDMFRCSSVDHPELYREFIDELMCDARYNWTISDRYIWKYYFSQIARELLIIAKPKGIDDVDIKDLYHWYALSANAEAFAQDILYPDALPKEYVSFITDNFFSGLRNLGTSIRQLDDNDHWATRIGVFGRAFSSMDIDLLEDSLFERLEASLLPNIPYSKRWLAGDRLFQLCARDNQELVFRICVRHIGYMDVLRLMYFKYIFSETKMWTDEIDRKVSKAIVGGGWLDS